MVRRGRAESRRHEYTTGDFNGPRGAGGHLAAVCAGHTHLPVGAGHPARDYLASDEPELWVLCSDSGELMGFMEMAGSKVDALFLAPEFHSCGGGRQLVRHAQQLRGELTVDVNEQ